MPIKNFPPHNAADQNGILAIGGDLAPESLLLAYRNGIFPWPISDLPLAWFSPPTRAILFFKEIHLPRSLARAQKKTTLRFTIDQAFKQVIQACSKVSRPGQDGTWITPHMIKAYLTFHELGYAHSCEAWNGERLVAGIYGVDCGGAFAGESMFHRESDASKLALLALIDHLTEKGLDWLDVQVMTPHLALLGAREISREAFLHLLRQTQSRKLRLFGPASEA